MPTYPDCSYVSAADTDEPAGASYIYCLAAEVRELKRATSDIAGLGFGLGSTTTLLPPCEGTTIADLATPLLTLESTDGNCFIQTAPYGDYSQIYVGTWGFTPGDLWIWSEAEPVPDVAYGAYIFQFYRSFTLAEIVAALNAALSVYSTFTAAVAGTADGTATILHLGTVIRNPPNGTFEADTAYDLVGACCVPASTACDPYWYNVVLAMHMDGVDGSTTFTDEKGNTVTRAAGVGEISTAQGMFGSSYYSPGGGFVAGGLSVTVSEDFHIASQMTYELFLYTISSLNGQVFSVNNYSEPGTSVNGGIYIGVTSTNNVVAIVDGTVLVASGGASPGVWRHIALVIDGTTVRLYINGELKETDTTAGVFITPDRVTIGVMYSVDIAARPLYGYIDDLRITKGIARYTEDFDPPTAPFDEVTCL